MQKKDYMIQLLKYFIMAIVVGIIVGAIDALFGRVRDCFKFCVNTKN